MTGSSLCIHFYIVIRMNLESYDLLTSPRRIFLIENSGCVHDEFLLSSLDKMLKNTSEIVMAIDKEFGCQGPIVSIYCLVNHCNSDPLR